MGIPQPLESTTRTISPPELVHNFIQTANIKIQVNNDELNTFPETGAAIVVVNRLYGVGDPFLVFHVLSAKRTDIAIFTDRTFDEHPELTGHFVHVSDEMTSDDILELLNQHLEVGRCIALFPSRTSNLTRLSAGFAMDKRWNPEVVKALYRSDAPVIPINIRTDAIVNLLHSRVFSFDRLTSLFHDLTAKEKKVEIRFGRPIAPNIRFSFANSEGFGRYVRAKLYSLGSAVEVNDFFPPLRKLPKTMLQRPIASNVDAELLATEIGALENEYLLFKVEEFSVFLAPSYAIPNTLRQIGIQREVAFRKVGEGSGEPFDLDEYDIYYRQLILWDHQKKAIAGGYRIGFGNEIIDRYGKRGFYINSLFKIKSPFTDILRQSLELGRSYVSVEYQKARLPLFLLWKGILAVLIKNSAYRYLIGPVSISNDYSVVSRQLMVAFVKKYFWNRALAQYVRPRKAFKPDCRDVDIESLMQQLNGDLKDLDQLISEIEPKHFKVPILLKKYVTQQARIIGFNVDPMFSNTLDGLIILDMKDIPVSTIENLNRELSPAQ